MKSKPCNCKVCKRSHRYNKLIASMPAKDKKFMEDFELSAMTAEDDNSFLRGITIPKLKKTIKGLEKFVR